MSSTQISTSGREKPHLDFINDFQVLVKKEGERRFKGKLGGCMPSLLTTRVNICQDRKASHWMMSSLFLDFKKTRFCMVLQCIPGMYCKFVCMCLCWLVGPVCSTSHYTELQIPADKCHIWTKPTILSKKFSPFFEIPTFLSELKVKASPLLSFLTKQDVGFRKSILLKTLSHGIEILALSCIC